MKKTQDQIDKEIDDYCASKVCPYRSGGDQAQFTRECLGRKCMKFSTRAETGQFSCGYGHLLCEGVPVHHMKMTSTE